MSEIDKAILKHRKNSMKLREIYMGDYTNKRKITWEKSKELQEAQDDEYKKMMFLKNLRREMMKK